MLVPRLLKGARPGAGGQEAGQGAVPPGGGGEVSLGLMSCSSWTGRGDGLKGPAQCQDLTVSQQEKLFKACGPCA